MTGKATRPLVAAVVTLILGVGGPDAPLGAAEPLSGAGVLQQGVGEYRPPAVEPSDCEPRPAGPRRLVVASGAEHVTLEGALDAARTGDTVALASGVYRERVVAPCPVVLESPSDAVLDGDGEGTVLTLRGPGTVVRGLTIRGSGADVSREDSGILADGAAGLVVEDVVLEDVLFGAYLKESPDARIRGNRVVGKDLPVNRRGDAIRLWYSPRSRIVDNRVQRARDVVIWFSDSVRVERNEVRDGRYGLHYMYSDHNRFEDNRFEGNLVGAFLMYSVDVEFAGNVFTRSAGASGIGLGLKDADRVRATGNDLTDNAVGIYLDNSPRSLGVENAFIGNRIVGNDVGVRVMPSSRTNRFSRNAFVDNAREVDVPGGGRATDNTWHRNHWSRYAGFDRDDDGAGDSPFVLNRLSDHLISSNPRLAVFAFSPAAEALDLLARILPFLEPRPVLVDPQPLLAPPEGADRTARRTP